MREQRPTGCRGTGREYEWKGRMMSLGTICRMEGVAHPSVKRKVLLGMSVAEAIQDTKDRRKSKYRLEYEGRIWTATDLAIYLGTDPTSLCRKLRRARETGQDVEFTVRDKGEYDDPSD